MTDKFKNPQSVELSASRWTATITIVDAVGAERVYFASADNGITFGDGIWFGTKEDYDALESY